MSGMPPTGTGIPSHGNMMPMDHGQQNWANPKMMHQTNSAIFWIFIIQIIFSLAGAIYCAYWTSENLDNPYLGFAMGDQNRAKNDTVYNVMTMAGSWILIFW